MKILIRKELMQILKPFFWNRKTGTKRSKISILGLLFLFIFIMLVVSSYFFLQAYTFFELMGLPNYDLYFSSFSFISTILSVFMSNLLLYNAMYVSKDNDLLLSSPIKPFQILISRLFPSFLFNFILTVFEIVPVFVVYLIKVNYDFINLLIILLKMTILIMLLPIFSLSISLIFVFIIGLILSKVRRKNVIQIILTVIFSVFYSAFFNIAARNTELVFSVMEKLESIFNSYLFYFGLLGKFLSLNTGISILYILSDIFITVFMLVVILYLMHKTFFKMMNFKAKEKKVKFNNNLIKVQKVKYALFRIENFRFIKNAIYFLNCGFGVVIMLIGAVAVCFTGGIIKNIPYISILTYIGVIMMLLSMTNISSASVSIEGNAIYISKTLPVKIFSILKSKIVVHLMYSLIPLTFLIISAIVFLKISLLDSVFLVLISILYTFFIAQLGLINDLKHGFTDWINETVAVKQNSSVMISISESLFPSIFITAFSFIIPLLTESVSMLLLIICSFLVVLLVIFNLTFYFYLKKNGEKLYLDL